MGRRQWSAQRCAEQQKVRKFGDQLTAGVPGVRFFTLLSSREIADPVPSVTGFHVARFLILLIIHARLVLACTRATMGNRGKYSPFQLSATVATPIAAAA